MARGATFLDQLLSTFRERDCAQVYLKALSPNDNSKNQIYLGGAESIPLLPWSGPCEVAGSSRKPGATGVIFRASVDFHWIVGGVSDVPAPETKVIFYPQYPECRLSGFLRGTNGAISDLMNSRLPGRYLFLGVRQDGQVFALVVIPTKKDRVLIDGLAAEVTSSAFRVLPSILPARPFDPLSHILHRFRELHLMGPVSPFILDGDGKRRPRKAVNAAGMTLEGLLGIAPNSRSGPDFQGWEVKAHSHGSPVTLFTPGPDGGVYVKEGFHEFMRRYGYPDVTGRPGRINFGGRHFLGETHARTGLRMVVAGLEKDLIVDPGARIELQDASSAVAVSWSFGKLLDHWNRKHSQALYFEVAKTPRGYSYGPLLDVARGTDFSLFIQQLLCGNVYYDPGHKIEAGEDGVKQRHQFRVNAKHLRYLYRTFESYDLSHGIRGKSA